MWWLLAAWAALVFVSEVRHYRRLAYVDWSGWLFGLPFRALYLVGLWYRPTRRVL